MKKHTRSKFALQSHLSPGTWLSHDRAYREYARESLARHEQHCDEVQNRWPVSLDQSINSRDYPELWQLNRERGQSSDTTRLYAAMAVEGFINFYGVLRFGAAVYEEHFERRPIVPKLKLLLLLSEGIDVPNSDPLLIALRAVSESRNRLVHPTAVEYHGDEADRVKRMTRVPGEAQDSIANLERFFKLFEEVVPAMAFHLDHEPDV